MPAKNTKIVVKIKRLNSEAHVPRYHYSNDSGADLYATEECILQPFEREAVPTGICAEVRSGFELQIRPKSGLALKTGITVLNTPGTIDAGYRGEIKVILINLSGQRQKIKKGQKIAQLVVSPVIHAKFEEVQELSESQRGGRGFGSSDSA